MGRTAPATSRPDWDQLYEIAASQQGFITTAQAGAAGYSSQLLNHYLRKGRISRVARGVYRLVHFPPGENEHLVIVWLWSEQQGVFGHETALALHELSDALPGDIHLTLPESWAKRRLRFPRGVVPGYARILKRDRAWVGSVPVTRPVRTLHDCVDAQVAPDLIRQAIEQGLGRGLFARQEIVRATRYVRSFGRRKR